jgi:hypothetical protein
MLRHFLKKNKSIGSIERKLISDNIYKIMRHKTYLDIIAPKPTSWENHLETMYTEKFVNMLNNTSLKP